MTLILGVTGSGKGSLAFELARRCNAEIISVDSMKIYRDMDIGTAKPPQQRREQIRHHLIDVVDPSEPFNAGIFLEKAEEAIEQIKSTGRHIIAVGGTALYIKALMYGLFEGPGSNELIRGRLQERCRGEGLNKLYAELEETDPEAASNIHPNDRKRIIRALEVFQLTGKPISSHQRQWSNRKMRHNWHIIGLRREKELESRRINQRVKRMIDEGLVNEVKQLLKRHSPLSPQAACAIGYAEITDHLNGLLSLEKAVERIKINTRRLAKGQRTWFKTFREVNWIDIDPDERTEDILKKTLNLK